jgi:light-regulated signal transduction histidine kinase (bacteriophytochrome)
VNDDFSVNPALAPWRESALDYGFRASAAFPLRRSGEPVGALTLYSEVPGAFDAEQVRLLEALCDDLSYALDAIQQDRLHAEAEQDLRRTAEGLARSNKELEQFAYISSHDLQEPLRMVSAYSGLLRERYQGQLDEKADQYLAFVLEGSQRMRLLINDLLAYSRVSDGASHLAPVAVREPLEAALADLRVAIDETGAAITQEQLPTVTSDRLLLAQVFMNLIGNALKFRTPGAAPAIHVGARRVVPAGAAGARDAQDPQRAHGAEWVFFVRDNGIGIDPRYADKIFDIFQRLHSRGRYEGTGIGLAICRKIVERHGGRIWVESEAGKGSTFFFSVPDDLPASPGPSDVQDGGS